MYPILDQPLGHQPLALAQVALWLLPFGAVLHGGNAALKKTSVSTTTPFLHASFAENADRDTYSVKIVWGKRLMDFG